MLTATICNTEVVDSTVEDENGNVQPSEVSILVNFEYDDIMYYLDYQTTVTCDYGAYSTTLAAYDRCYDYDKLRSLIDDDDRLADLLDQIKTDSKCQSVYDDYIKSNFYVSKDEFNGMDANSKTNVATRKP